MNLPKFRQQVLKKFAADKKDKRIMGMVGYRKHMENCEQLLLSSLAQSFILPANGEIVKHTTPVHIKFEDLKLPFDRCIFEYPIAADYYTDRNPKYDQPDATVLLVEKTEDSLTLFPIWHIKDKQTNTSSWTPCMFGLLLDRDSYIEVLDNDEATVRVLNPKVLTASEEMNAIYDSLSTETKQQAVLELVDELRVVAHFAMLCGCDNVNAKKIYTPSEESARVAKLRGKPKPYDYWVLDVYMNDDHESSGSGEGGSHSSPRFHVRRGHIRRYQTGKTTWVRQCVVGTPELGIIQKDYRVVA